MVGSVTPVADDAGCSLPDKWCLAGGAGRSFQQHLARSLHGGERGRDSGGGGFAEGHGHGGVAF